MTTRIGVMVRIRPQLEFEKKKGFSTEKLSISEETQEIIINGEENQIERCYQFTKIITQNQNQKQCFDDTKLSDMVNRVIEGFHSTVFAYGQTGSGKTFTMEGITYENNGKGLKPQIEPEAIRNENMGIIPRTIISTFETIKKYSRVKNRIYKVYLSYLQIYNEKIYDLLNPESSKGLRIRWSKKDQFSVENLFVFECQNANEALELFYKGIKNKFMATHRLNTQSSRSHCILTLRVDSMTAEDPDNIISSKMQLVDLAGSERASQSGVEGQNLKEAIEINKSLFTLRQVISALAEYFQDQSQKKEMPFVPYRDSKLTCLLKQSIGGNSYCLMIACLSPCDEYFDENISTLNYATQAGFITNQPVRNEDPRIKQINILKSKNSELIKELHKANEHIAFLSSLTNQTMKVFGQDYMNGKTFSPQGNKQNKIPSPTKTLDFNYVNQNENINPGFQTPSELRRSHNIQNTQYGEKINEREILIKSQQISFGNAGGQNRENILQPLNTNSPTRFQPVLNKSFMGQVSPGSNLQTIKGFAESDKKSSDSYQQAKLDSENNSQQSKQTNYQIQQQQQFGENLNNQQLQIHQANISQLSGVANGFGFTTLGQDFAIKRLIDSVNMIRELLQSNTEMREIIDSMNQEKENFNAELNILQMENQDLREKLEIMETFHATSSEVSSESTNECRKNNNQDDILSLNKREIASEILQLRKDKRKLNQRIKQLEIENLNLQNIINPNFTHAEPTRTHLQATPSSQINKSRSIITPHSRNESRQNQLQNSNLMQIQDNCITNGIVNVSPFPLTNNNNNQNGNNNPLDDITNQQEGSQNMMSTNYCQARNKNQINCNSDCNKEQKTRFVRREQSNQSSKQYLRENSTKVSIGLSNSYIGQQQQQSHNQLSQQYHQQLQQQSISTVSQHNYKQCHSNVEYNLQQQANIQSNQSIYLQTQNPQSSNQITSLTENDCPQKSPNLYQYKKKYPKQSQTIHLSNNFAYSLTNAQTTTSIVSSSNVPKTAFVLKEAKQEEIQNQQLIQNHYQYMQQQQQIPLNKSINSSHINSGVCSSSSSSSGYYANVNNQNTSSINNRTATNPNCESKSPNSINRMAQIETAYNWKIKITPKNNKQRSITGGKKPPRTQEEGNRWCKTPLQQRPDMSEILPILNNHSISHNIQNF
ncbi:kinesin motor catalytic domain protein (macronuclear) [Tetrahymena thermophila SB210]|uniref:Kinesin motor catalytic domain protein n=1 Tax=Tetrahymena thermophila (strain SB210) TaxID=312017 RepID=Q24CJ5_TETTS|nr:kinesin motor catalytic domain protein [Tetrahymena thermophila SB210]EAS05465.2 kinesin motor catalytic domain protein [Tetrahymena thermophila SB210]|eukprot:XP_001025710.2 kinesin motor catalytic domain protein [Tetrahymena thermophila SB210]